MVKLKTFKKFKLELSLNPCGEIVCHLVKGKKKYWFFNINNGAIAFDIVYSKDTVKDLQKLGIDFVENSYGEPRPALQGIEELPAEVVRKLEHVINILEHTDNV